MVPSKHAKRILIVGVMLGTITLCQRQARADDLKIAENFVAAWNSHDPDAVAALYTNDAWYIDPQLPPPSASTPQGTAVQGRAAIRGLAAYYFGAFQDFHLTLLNATFKGNSGTIEYLLTASLGGKSIHTRGVALIETVGQEIARSTDYYDYGTILRDLGVLPPGF